MNTIKKRALTSIALCFSFFMFMCSVSTVYAYNTYNQHKLTYGVGNYGKDT